MRRAFAGRAARERLASVPEHCEAWRPDVLVCDAVLNRVAHKVLNPALDRAVLRSAEVQQAADLGRVATGVPRSTHAGAALVPLPAEPRRAASATAHPFQPCAPGHAEGDAIYYARDRLQPRVRRPVRACSRGCTARGHRTVGRNLDPPSSARSRPGSASSVSSRRRCCRAAAWSSPRRLRLARGRARARAAERPDPARRRPARERRARRSARRRPRARRGARDGGRRARGDRRRARTSATVVRPRRCATRSPRCPGRVRRRAAHSASRRLITVRRASSLVWSSRRSAGRDSRGRCDAARPERLRRPDDLHPDRRERLLVEQPRRQQRVRQRLRERVDADHAADQRGQDRVRRGSSANRPG